jgi:hypothetical protein
MGTYWGTFTQPSFCNENSKTINFKLSQLQEGLYVDAVYNYYEQLVSMFFPATACLAKASVSYLGNERVFLPLFFCMDGRPTFTKLEFKLGSFGRMLLIQICALSEDVNYLLVRLQGIWRIALFCVPDFLPPFKPLNAKTKQNNECFLSLQKERERKRKRERERESQGVVNG